MCKTFVCHSKAETIKRAEKLGYPVVLKVDSEKVIHKSDLGLVKTEIASKEELSEILEKFELKLKKLGIASYSFVVQEQLKGTELMAGMKRDAQFGPVIVFGLGGIYVELIKDTAIGIAPLTRTYIERFISKTKASKLFKGLRGKKPISKEAIIDMLIGLSTLSIKEEYIKEIDFNPIIADNKKAYVADARVIV